MQHHSRWQDLKAALGTQVVQDCKQILQLQVSHFAVTVLLSIDINLAHGQDIKLTWQQS